MFGSWCEVPWLWHAGPSKGRDTCKGCRAPPAAQGGVQEAGQLPNLLLPFTGTFPLNSVIAHARIMLSKSACASGTYTT